MFLCPPWYRLPPTFAQKKKEKKRLILVFFYIWINICLSIHSFYIYILVRLVARSLVAQWNNLNKPSYLLKNVKSTIVSKNVIRKEICKRLLKIVYKTPPNFLKGNDLLKKFFKKIKGIILMSILACICDL